MWGVGRVAEITGPNLAAFGELCVAFLYSYVVPYARSQGLYFLDAPV
jgi:hypothetical protein